MVVAQEGVEVLASSAVTLSERKEIHVDTVSGAKSYYCHLKVDDGVAWEVRRRDKGRWPGLCALR